MRQCIEAFAGDSDRYLRHEANQSLSDQNLETAEAVRDILQSFLFARKNFSIEKKRFSQDYALSIISVYFPCHLTLPLKKELRDQNGYSHLNYNEHNDPYP
jgi:hypothetical protein